MVIGFLSWIEQYPQRSSGGGEPSKSQAFRASRMPVEIDTMRCLDSDVSNRSNAINASLPNLGPSPWPRLLVGP
jgi:hypothetical protein